MSLRPDQLFKQPCEFKAGVQSVEQLLRPHLPEIAFFGRSNVGKSSLLNALTNNAQLARVSNTPGRTQQLNFFDLGTPPLLTLVDLPGYGYAKVAKTKRADWGDLISAYLAGRTTLVLALVLVDARHEMKDIDNEMLSVLDGAAVASRVILTKGDELKPAELALRVEQVTAKLRKHPAAFPTPCVTSAESGLGIDELQQLIMGAALSRC